MPENERKLPSKMIELGGYRYNIFGPSEDDTYFGLIHDNFEPSFLEICGRIIKPDSVCLDIGANLGIKSLIMAQFATDGRIVSVEASPTVARALRANADAHGAGRITVLQCAAGDADGQIRFQDNSCFGHIAPDGIAVPLKRLSTIMKDTGLERLDFVKMDIEGFEEPVLRDARDLIIASGAVAFFEFNTWTIMRCASRSPLEFAEWIYGAFSHVFMVRSKGGNTVLERIDQENWWHIPFKNIVDDASLRAHPGSSDSR